MALRDLVNKNIFGSNPATNPVLASSLNKSSNIFKASQGAGQAPMVPQYNAQTVPLMENNLPMAAGEDPYAGLLDGSGEMAPVEPGAPSYTADESAYAGLLDGGSPSPNTSSGITNSDMMHTMSAIDNAFQGKSSSDLWTLRQQLAQQKALALAGILPAEQQGNAYNGAGVTEGTPHYNFQDTQAVNRATGDIFSPQIENLDAYLHDVTQKSSGGTPNLDTLSGDLSDINNQIISALAMNEPTPARQEAVAKYYSNVLKTQGSDAFLQLVVPKAVALMSAPQQVKYDEITGIIPGFDTALTTIINNPKVVSGFATAKWTDLARKFNRQGDNTYLLLQQQLESPQSKQRVQVAGTALTGTEKSQIEKNFFAESDTTQDVARKLAFQIAALTAYEQTEPLRQLHYDDKAVRKLTQDIYYKTLKAQAQAIQPHFPSAAAALMSSLPKDAPVTQTPSTGGTGNTGGGNSYGGLI